MILFGCFLGLLLAILLGWFVLGPLYYSQVERNGGPFKVGDEVLILTGPFRDRVARVYSPWQGDRVRVDLGEEAKQRFRDIFSQTQLLNTQTIRRRKTRGRTSGCTRARALEVFWSI